jgi:hypothetical protein
MSQTIRVFSRLPIPLCFTAMTGRRYIATGSPNPNGTWTPQILDERTTRPLSSWLASPDESCRQDISARRPP